MAIDRTAYNALVDDDGSNLVGTPWTKDIVKTVLLDPMDAALAALPAPIATPVGPADGGTGLTTYAVGDLIIASGATALARLPVVAAGAVLVSGAAPAWSTTPTVTSLTVGAGAVATPSLALPGGYGFFGGSGASRIGVGYGGVERMRFDATAADYGFALAATSTLMWNSGALSGATTCDTRLRRTGAGTLALDNGAGAGGVFLAGTAVGIGAIIAAAGDVRGTSTLSIKARNAANSADITLLSLATDRVVLGGASGNAQITIDPGTADVQWGKALVAVGPTTLITLGKTGGSGPATAAQNAWLRLLDSTGAACWIPVWK